LATHEGDREILDTLRNSFSFDGEHLFFDLIFFQFAMGVLYLKGFLELSFCVLGGYVLNVVLFVLMGREALGYVEG